MIYLIHADAQFVVQKELVLHTIKGEYYLEAGKIIGFLKTEDGRLFIGTGEEGSDQLEITGKIAAGTLLEACQPSNFELSLDEEGDSYIRPVLLEEKVTLEEKILRIEKTESAAKKTVPVLKIEEIQ